MLRRSVEGSQYIPREEQLRFTRFTTMATAPAIGLTSGAHGTPGQQHGQQHVQQQPSSDPSGTDGVTDPTATRCARRTPVTTARRLLTWLRPRAAARPELPPSPRPALPPHPRPGLCANVVDLPDDSRDFAAFTRLLLGEPEVAGYGCNRCGKDIDVRELRFHCWFCDDAAGGYDECQTCAAMPSVPPPR